MIELTNLVASAANLTANISSNVLTTSLSSESDSAPVGDLLQNATAAAIELGSRWSAVNISLAPPAHWHSNASHVETNGIGSGAAGAAAVTDLLWLNGVNTSLEADFFDKFPCHKDNPNFNCSREEYLLFAMGPQMLPLAHIIVVTLIFGGIFITGILGNVLVCVVIVRHSTMHTATNYYLFSLAVSDLLFLIFGLPADVFIYWHQYPYLFGLPFCKFRAFISEASTYVSVLTIVAFSMERFLAICHPLHLYAMSGFKRALRIIAALWIVSFISAIPFGLMSTIHYLRYPLDDAEMADSSFCFMEHPDNFPLFGISFCIFFVIPMILIIILYSRMGMQIRSRTTQQLGVQQGSMHKESRHSQSRKAVIRMLAAVVITFFVCGLPFHIQRLMYIYARHWDNYGDINEWLFSVTGFAYYISCTINPILYNVMSHRYRVAFKDIVCGKRRSVYYNNGFARDQSSFRETTIASSLTGAAHGNSNYDRVHSVRVRSLRHHMNNVKDRDSLKSNNALWGKKPPAEFTVPLQQDIPEDSALTNTTATATTTMTSSLGTNVVVVVDNGVNGRPKVYTENEAQESLINKDNETCI